MSKWAGLAGLRVGYGIMSPSVVKHIVDVKSPYNVSVASEAQSTNSNADADSEPVDSWSSDFKAPLRPADDVGGSWNWMLLYGRMIDAALPDVFAFNYAWDEAKLFSLR